MLCANIVLNVKTLYCELTDARMRASEKDLPVLDLSHSVIALVESSSKGRGRGFNYWLTTPLISSM